MNNVDRSVVEDFGNEWDYYTQDAIAESDLEAAFNQYFDIFPFSSLGSNAVGFDMGCGSGRWAYFVADKVAFLNCIDPSDKALAVAKKKLSKYRNVRFECAPVDAVTLDKGSQDFGYCLGVLHHIPDTMAGVRSCAELLRSGAPFLMYLYYDFENRSGLFRALWKISDVMRRAISSLPFGVKKIVTTLIAFCVYYPFARLSFILEKLGHDVRGIPLSDYRNKDFYFMKTDALDRFGTKLEKRFSRKAIKDMLEEAGFRDVRFSNGTPYWVSIAYKT